MIKVFLPLVLIISVLAACKKDKTVCFQTDVTLDYDTYNQYDSMYTTPKLCMDKDEASTLTFGSQFDPITGQQYIFNETGTSSSRYYDNQRSDSVTRSVNTYSVSE